MKRKLTLGLLVFFVGVLITACGGDETASTTVTNNNYPLDLRDVVPECIGHTNTCRRTVPSVLSITNTDLYLSVMGYNGNYLSQTDIEIPVIDLHRGVDGLVDNGLDLATDLGNCFIRVGLTRALVEGIKAITGGEVSGSATCGISTNEVANADKRLRGSETLGSQYNAEVIFYYHRNELDRVYLKVHTPTEDGRDDEINFMPVSGRSYLVNEGNDFMTEGTLVLDLSGNRLRLRLANGNQVATLRRR